MTAWFHDAPTRHACAETYARLLRTLDPAAPLWTEINAELLTRYKPSGLRWIKARAWQIGARGGAGK